MNTRTPHPDPPASSRVPMTGYTFNITSPDYWDSAPYIRHSAYSDKTRNKLTITEQKYVIFRYFYLRRITLQSQNTASLTSRFSNRLCKHISTQQYNIIDKMGRSSTTLAIFTLLLRNDNHQFVFDKIHQKYKAGDLPRVYIPSPSKFDTKNGPNLLVQPQTDAFSEYSGSLSCIILYTKRSCRSEKHIKALKHPQAPTPIKTK